MTITITTRFNIGDKVYYIDQDNLIRPLTVNNIHAFFLGKMNDYYYSFQETSQGASEDFLYATEEEALEHCSK